MSQSPATPNAAIPVEPLVAPPNAPPLDATPGASLAVGSTVTSSLISAPAQRALPIPFIEFCERAKGLPREDLLEGILPVGGIALLVGHAFAGKTVFLACLAAAAERGLPLAGRQVYESDILYCALEHSDATFADLFTKAARGAGLETLTNTYVLKELDLDDENAVKHLADCADGVGAHLIVIDSLRMASRMRENESNEMAEVVRRIAPLTNGGQRLVVVVHHLGKNNETRGSTALPAGVDTEVKLSRARDGLVTLRVRQHGRADSEYRLRFSFGPDSVVALPGAASAALTAGGLPAAANNYSSLSRGDARRAAIRQAILRACAEMKTTNALRLAVREQLGGVGNGAVDRERDVLVGEQLLRDANQDGVRGTGNRWVAVVPTVVSVPPGSDSITVVGLEEDSDE